MKNLKRSTIALSILIALLLGGCGDSMQQKMIKVVKLSMKLGYECAEEGKTLKECEGVVDSAMVKAL